MWAIRASQYEELERAEWAAFLARARSHVREGLPEHTAGLSDQQLTTRIEAAADRAARYGLVTEFDILCFLDASFLLHDEQFDSNPRYAPLQVVLNDTSLASDDKAEQILVLAAQQAPAA